MGISAIISYLHPTIPLDNAESSRKNSTILRPTKSCTKILKFEPPMHSLPKQKHHPVSLNAFLPLVSPKFSFLCRRPIQACERLMFSRLTFRRLLCFWDSLGGMTFYENLGMLFGSFVIGDNYPKSFFHANHPFHWTWKWFPFLMDGFCDDNLRGPPQNSMFHPKK